MGFSDRHLSGGQNVPGDKSDSTAKAIAAAAGVKGKTARVRLPPLAKFAAAKGRLAARSRGLAYQKMSTPWAQSKKGICAREAGRSVRTLCTGIFRIPHLE